MAGGFARDNFVVAHNRHGSADVGEREIDDLVEGRVISMKEATSSALGGVTEFIRGKVRT